MVVFLFNTVIYVFLLLSFMYSYFMYLHRASWHSSDTLPDVFPCFFLSFKANARVKPTKTGHGQHSSKLFVLSYVLFVLCRSVYCVCVCVCKCVLYCCHRVSTQLQLTDISYHITSHHITYHISYHIISYHIISYHIISYHIISYHIISYRIISYHTILYYIIYHTISYRIIIILYCITLHFKKR